MTWGGKTQNEVTAEATNQSEGYKLFSLNLLKAGKEKSRKAGKLSAAVIV